MLGRRRMGEGASKHDTYLLAMLVPDPRGDRRERFALADQHPCVPLVAMLGLLVHCHLGRNYGKRKRIQSLP